MGACIRGSLHVIGARFGHRQSAGRRRDCLSNFDASRFSNIAQFRGPRCIVRSKTTTCPQPVSLGVHSLEQAEAFVVVPPIAHELLAAFPRGSLTLLLEAQQPVDPRLGGERIAVRVLEHPTARALVAHVGPVTAPSANPSGEPPLESAEAAGIGLGISPNSILAGACPGGLGSTFVSLIEDEDEPSGFSVSIMREGVAPANEVRTWMLMRV